MTNNLTEGNEANEERRKETELIACFLVSFVSFC